MGKFKNSFGWQIVIPILGFVLICGVTVVLIQLFKHTENKQPLLNESPSYDMVFTMIEDDINMLVDFVENLNTDNTHEMIVYLKTYQRNHPYILNAYVGTSSGRMVLYPEGQDVPVDFDPRIRPWYQKAISKPGEVVVTDPYTNAGDGAKVISVAKTISDNGDLIGVVSIDITPSTIKKLAAANFE